jgi:hypothetical protein
MGIRRKADEEMQEILEIIKEGIAPYCSNPDQVASLADKIVKYFKIIPSQEAPLKRGSTIGIVIMKKGGVNGMLSSKWGNILLNFKEFLNDVPTIALTIVDILKCNSEPLDIIRIVSLVLFVLLRIKSWKKIERNEKYAAVIWTISQYKDDNDFVEAKNLLKKVNSELRKFNRSKMSKGDLEDILQDLEKIGCIKRKDNGWQLKEKVIVK